MVVVRYADDTVVGFEHRSDAESFLAQLRIRMAEFALELHPEKTRLIEFGRKAGSDRAARGDGKPETFDFLGFTHICSRSLVFATSCPLVRPVAASYPVAVRQVAISLRASFRRSLALPPLRFTRASPPSGCTGDFHPQAAGHAQHTGRFAPR
jgi:Reverse transcriptase (RNA-dependent DNA polymerase)